MEEANFRHRESASEHTVWRMKQALKKVSKEALARVGLLELARSIRRFKYRHEISIFLRNLRHLAHRPPDGLPIPPVNLINLVSGGRDIDWFMKSGRDAAESIVTMLEKNGLALGRFKAILDFGCGCGRVLRYWKSLQSTQIYSVDCNPALTEWCARHLVFFSRLDEHPEPTFGIPRRLI